MEKEILLNKQLPLKKRLKNILFYFSRKRGAHSLWENRHQKVLNENLTYDKPIDKTVEFDHKKLWAPFRKDLDLTTLRICCNMSGVQDARMVPEALFVSDIEPTLISDEIAHFFSHKSYYNRIFDDGIFPKDIVHCIGGQYLDDDLRPINFKELTEKVHTIEYPVVMKPNKDSYGGEGVFFVKDPENLIDRCMKSRDFVVQEYIIQDDFFKKYNPDSLNTIRVYVYKSVKDDSYHILNMALRMGKGGSLDNETSGGIHTMINSDGSLNGYAVDKYGTVYSKHPDTGCTFHDQILAYNELIDLAIDIGRQIHFTRLIGLDVCYDNKGNWRVIEINTKAHTIRFAQYGGQPFFGEFTAEIIEYCNKNHWTLTDSL